MTSDNRVASAQPSETRPLAEGLFEPAASPGGLPILLGSKCKSCGEVVFPRVLDCPACFGFETMQEHPLEGRGHVRDFVVAYRGPSGFAVPYIQAYVKLVDGPVIFSSMTGCLPTDDALVPGQEVVMTIERIRSVAGVDIMGWKFLPLGVK